MTNSESAKTREVLKQELQNLNIDLTALKHCLKIPSLLFGCGTAILTLVSNIYDKLDAYGIAEKDIAPAFTKLSNLIKILDEITRATELCVPSESIYEKDTLDIIDDVYTSFKGVIDDIAEPKDRIQSLPTPVLEKTFPLGVKTRNSLDDIDLWRDGPKRGILDASKFNLNLNRFSNLFIESDRFSTISQLSMESGFESISASPTTQPTNPTFELLCDQPTKVVESTTSRISKHMLQTLAQCSYTHEMHSSNIDLRSAEILSDKPINRFRNVSQRIGKYVSVIKSLSSTPNPNPIETKSEFYQSSSLPYDFVLDPLKPVENKVAKTAQLPPRSPLQRKPVVSKRIVNRPPPLKFPELIIAGSRPVSVANAVEEKMEKKDEKNPMEDLDTTDILMVTGKKTKIFHVMGGTCDALIIKATKRNELFTKTFIATYRTFIEPIELIKKLLYRYKYFAKRTYTESAKAAESSYLVLIQVFNSLNDNDINDEIIKLLMDIIYHMIRSGELIHAIMMRDFFHKKLIVCKLRNQVNTPLHEVCSERLVLLKCRPCDIAEQITLVDSELYRKIDVIELLWNSKGKKNQNITTFIEQFERLSYWVQYTILSEQNSRTREKLMAHFLEIMKCLYKLRNISSCIAIVIAISGSNIVRLDWGRSVRNTIAEFSKLASPEKNWEYTNHLMEKMELPSIPFVLIYLKYLEAINELKPNKLDNNMINFEKRKDQYEIIHKFQRFKQVPYEFTKIPSIYNYIKCELQQMDQETLYELSQQLKAIGT